MADYSEIAKYYYTEDHIGRPFNLRDESRTLRWYENHYPFGEIINEETPGEISSLSLIPCPIPRGYTPSGNRLWLYGSGAGRGKEKAR